MKKNEIEVGGHYVAKVNGQLRVVRVDNIRVYNRSFGGCRSIGREQTVYEVTNTETGRKTTFRSASKFRSPAPLTGAKARLDKAIKELVTKQPPESKRLVKVVVEKKDDIYLGEKTGRIVFHVMETGGCGSGLFRGCPLGRGDTEDEALQDFCQRANADDAELKLMLRELVVARREDQTGRVNPSDPLRPSQKVETSAVGNTHCPILPLQQLPNGATVLEIHSQPGPVRRWVVLAVWVRDGASEYIVWNLIVDPSPDLHLSCDSGDYRRSMVEAWDIFTERSNRYSA